jgi:dTDP-glucose 4,6-dehydratase
MHIVDRPILVTGGAGFIGSNFILHESKKSKTELVNLDKLTYAGNLGNLATLERRARYRFVEGDIGDADLLARLFAEIQPRAVVHFAAESHVDRSIHGPEEFILTNAVGTASLLQAALRYWEKLDDAFRPFFRFLHVSTDEVYGALNPDDAAFTEANRYDPRSPYSASKAAADHFVRAWYHTYGLPVLITNCSNNFGPYQFPEKLIPLAILTALGGDKIPIYGDGKQVRDWLYVEDHCRALSLVLRAGRVGETYNIGGDAERKNLDVARLVCQILDDIRPLASGGSRENCIEFVKDRPGHDRRYAVDATKIKTELGWCPSETFESALRETVHWYILNADWIESVRTGAYRKWIADHYDRALQ